MEYHKIQTMFKREMQKPCKIIYGEWTLPEFDYLKDNKWQFTEKVDGTNIRVYWDGANIKINGRTDNAQLHCDLIKRIEDLFYPQTEKLKELFKPKDGGDVSVCFYGEGYGAGIQKGGTYKPTKDLVIFDILIENWWLGRGDVESICKGLRIDTVPVVGEGTLQQGIDMVRSGLKSRWGDFVAEGIVARPLVELKARNGKRIITKIKYVDFNREGQCG